MGVRGIEDFWRKGALEMRTRTMMSGLVVDGGDGVEVEAGAAGAGGGA